MTQDQKFFKEMTRLSPSILTIDIKDTTFKIYSGKNNTIVFLNNNNILVNRSHMYHKRIEAILLKKCIG